MSFDKIRDMFISNQLGRKSFYQKIRYLKHHHIFIIIFESHKCLKYNSKKNYFYNNNYGLSEINV